VIPVGKKWAAIYANDESICVQTCSGLRRSVADPQGTLVFMAWPPSHEELGDALKTALLRSRTLAPEQLSELFDVNEIKARYESWVATYMQRFGYASRRALFKDMKHCPVEFADGVIKISATTHDESEGWSGRGIDVDLAATPEAASAPELGEAALRAIGLCR
jgi:hypothetical protein